MSRQSDAILQDLLMLCQANTIALERTLMLGKLTRPEQDNERMLILQEIQTTQKGCRETLERINSLLAPEFRSST